MEYLDKIRFFINFIFYDNADPRIRDKFFMGNPFPIIFTTLILLTFLRVLNEFMKRRKEGFKLEKLSLYVTIFYWFMSVYFFYKLSRDAYFNGYSLRCEPVDPSPVGKPMEVSEEHSVMITCK